MILPESEAPKLRTILAPQTLNYRRGDWLGRRLLVEVDSISAERVTAGPNPQIKVEILLSAPAVWARDADSKTFSTSAQFIECFPGMTGPISDALIIIGGTGMANPTITDYASATNLTITGGRTGFFRIESATGAVFQVPGIDSWGGGTGISPAEVILPPKLSAAFEITPITTTGSSGAIATIGRVALTSLGSGFQMAVRGRGAYAV